MRKVSFLLIAIGFISIFQEGNSLNATDDENDPFSARSYEKSNILSRKKRFITFPDGSSVQLVFETQNHGYLQIGNIVWFSNTAALAWELPTDPSLLYLLKDKNNYSALRRNDQVNKNVFYLDDKGKVLAKVPYKKKMLINPTMGKRSVDSVNEIGPSQTVDFQPTDIGEMHEKQKNRDYLKNDISNVLFHREGRKGLYEKLESFIEALGWKGRECVLRLLCEAGKDKSVQGTFLEEIVRAVFTLPAGAQFEEKHQQQYDEAHQTKEECTKIYPDCIQKVTGENLFSSS